MKLKAGVEFTGDPDQYMLVSPQTVYDAIPESETLWRERFKNIVGHSIAPEYKRKGEIFGYALNAYAQKELPQYFYATNTFYQATQTFLLSGDLTAKENPFDENFQAFFTVSGSALYIAEITEEAEPCFNRYESEPGFYTYFGYAPFLHKAVPQPGLCVNSKTPYEVAQRKPNFNPADNDAFFWRLSKGGSTTWLNGGGVNADVNDIEVLEGGLIYVSLPDLPMGAPEPPPLVGYVVDYGPPGPAGPPGPPGLPGADGSTMTGPQIVDEICGMPSNQKSELKSCLSIPEDLSYLGIVLGAPSLEVKAAQQIILETAPEVLLPQTEVVLIDEGVAMLEAIPTVNLGWKLLLTLPIALLIGMKMLNTRIKVGQCGPDGKPIVTELPFPILSFQDANQKAVFQEIFDQFWYLQQCCKPCDFDGWDYIGTFEGPYENYQLKDYDAIRLKFVGLPGPEINTWYRTGTIFKLGEFRWAKEDHIDVHLGGFFPWLSELEFWNSYTQVFEAPDGLTIGFKLDMEYIKPYEVWARIRGVPPSQAPDQVIP